MTMITGPKDLMVDGPLANVGTGIVFPIRSSTLAPFAGYEPRRLQDQRILEVTSISLERLGEPQGPEMCLEERSRSGINAASTTKAMAGNESSRTHVQR